MKTIALMPAYNEGKRIGKTVLRTKKYVDRIVVVDDGSTDMTASVARKAGATVVRYDKNMGKGYATKMGMKKIFSLKPDIIVFIDADGQHDPKYIPQFIEKVMEGRDYVYGKRDLSNYPLDRKIGNFGLTLITNIACPTGIADTECGFRALTVAAARKLSIKADGYQVEMDFAYSAWKGRFKIGKVKIVVPLFHPKSAIRRGVGNLAYILKRRF